MKRLYTALCTVLITLLSGFPAYSSADDTEIYLLQGARPNILFMLDYSSSLNETIVDENGDETSTTRMKAWQEALIQSFDNAENVNIGIGRFSKHNIHGNSGIVNVPIEYRVAYIDDVIGSNTNRTITVAIEDGAIEDADKVVSLVDADLVLSQCFDPCATPAADAPAYNTAGLDACSVTTMQVDGEDIPINEHNCTLSDTSENDNKMTICHIPPGNDANSHTIEISKSAWPAHLAHGDRAGPCLTQTNLDKITDKKADICHFPPGNPGNAQDINISINAVGTHLDEHCDTLGKCDNGPEITCSDSKCGVDVCIGSSVSYVALRFQGVNIPKGVTINSASIAFNITDDVSSETLSISTQVPTSSDTVGAFNPDAFTTTDADISSRDISNAVSWSTSDWSDDSVVSTPDIESLISEVTDGNEWCGGSDLVFIIQSTSEEALRQLVSYNGDSDTAPSLNLDFDVPVDNTGCINANTDKSVVIGNDDVEEMINDGTLYADSDQLEIADRIVGLRFQNLAIAQDATVLDAYLELKASTDSTDDNGFDVYGEEPNLLSQFKTDKSFHVANRYNSGKTTASVEWSSDDWTTGEYYQSDLTTIVQEIVSNNTWETYNDMVFFLRGDTDKAIESGSATLHIQIEGDLGTDGTGEVSTVSIDLKNQVANLKTPEGEWLSPTVNGLYEAAQYYLGSDVDYGKDRHGDREYLVSHPDTYSGGTLDQDEACNLDSDPFSNDCASEEIDGSPIYISPVECPNRNHIVILSNGVPEVTAPNTNSDVKSIIGPSTSCMNSFENAAGETIKVNNSSNGYDGRCGIDLADYLETLDNNITTHTIGLQLEDGIASDYLQRLASEKESGGRNFYSADSVTELVTALERVYETTLPDNASFASIGISVDRFNPIRHNQEAYFSLFKPANTARWSGNLKKYKLTSDGLFDANDNPATNSENYLISDAQSFWSTDVDGDQTTKGGAGEQLQASEDDRILYTSVNGNLVLLSGITSDALGLTDDSVKNWILGQDVNDEDGDDDVTDNRWMFADPLHSRPLALTYAAATEVDGNTVPDVTKVFVGTNDGLLRMIDANTGAEDWAFLPSELLGIQEDLMNNYGSSHIYGLDGSPQLWVNNKGDKNIVVGDDKARLYIGMRRGGNNIYALDVTDTTSEPDLMWTIKGGVTNGFDKLGQTWSSPKPVQVAASYCGSGETVCMAVMFGGGYDASHDATDANGTVFTDTATTGNTIYMVNALNGDLLWSATDSNNNDFAEMKYPIPSDLTLIDTNGDGITNRLYVGDIGGQVWRVNLSGADSTSGSRIADLASTTNSERRRFFYPPLWTKSDDKTDEIIVIGSGTRQNPLETVVENRLYVFLDNGTEVDENDLSSVALDSDNHNDKSDGWYLELSEGEKVLSAAIVDEMDDEKIVSFATYIPVLDTSTDPCANKQGQSYLYTMSLNTAKGVFEVDTNGSLLGINVDPDVDTTVRSIATRTGISSGPKKVYSAEADSASKTGITDGYIDPIPTGTNKSESLYWKQVH